jgi:undecaprenyl-diphosphatase
MDDRIQFLINREWTHPVLDWLMAIASSYDFWMPFVYLLVALMLWRGGFRARMCVLTLGLILLVLNQAAGLAKKQFDRPRPSQHMPNVRQVDLDPQTSPRVMALGKPLMEKIGAEPATIQAGKGRSFPSGHTTNLFATATVVAVFYRRRGWLAYVPAILVGYSRVYTGGHHPSDVIVTSLLSLAFTLLLLAGFGWLWHRFGGRATPRIHALHPHLFGEPKPVAA